MAYGWVIGVLGAWLLVEPFLVLVPVANAVVDWAVGGVALVAGIALAARGPRAAWQGWVAALAGAWLIAAPFMPALIDRPWSFWNTLLSGIVLCIAGFAAVGERLTSNSGGT